MIYRQEVIICATAYIKAANKADLDRKIAALTNASPTILDYEGDVPISGLGYSDPNLPNVSLSPAMTIHGVWPGSGPEEVE